MASEAQARTGDAKQRRSPRQMARAAFASYRRDLAFVRALQQPAPATRILLLLLGAVFLLGYALTAFVIEPSYGAPETSLEPITYLAAKVNQPIREGQVWRLVTHAFLHAGLLHILVNAYALHALGSITERMFGTARFVLIYAASGLAGGVASFVFNDTASVGASGAIFGVFGAAVVFGYRYRDRVPEHVAKALSRGLLPWLLLSLAFGLLPQIDNAAHFGGLAAGAALAAVIGSPLASSDGERTRQVLRACVALVVAAAVFSWLMALEHTRRCVGDEASWEACQVPLSDAER